MFLKQDNESNCKSYNTYYYTNRFGKKAEMVRLIGSGYITDIPGVYFHKRLKGSSHPFHKSFYEKAAKKNRDLADNMDTCIVK